jgi:tetratricopeptide (TPR) repeat protein
MDGKVDESHRLYEQAVQAWPQEKVVIYMAGDTYFHEGQVAKALPYFERALQLDPTWEPALLHLCEGLMSLDRMEEYREVVRRWVERAPGPVSLRELAIMQGAEGRLDDALANARRAYQLQPDQMQRDVLARIHLQRREFSEVVALNQPGVADVSHMLDAEPVTYLHQALMLLGRWREALQVLEHLRVAFPADYRARRVRHFLCEGRPAEARAELDAFAPGWRGGTGPGADQARSRVVQFAAIAALLAPGSPLAEELARAVRGKPPEGFVRGLGAGRAGRFEEAAALLEPVANQGEVPGALASYALGELEAARGHQAEALATMKRYQENPNATWPAFACVAWPRSIFVSAAALDALGRRDEARAKVDTLLDTWKSADPDLPLLAEARALRARLAAASK